MNEFEKDYDSLFTGYSCAQEKSEALWRDATNAVLAELRAQMGRDLDYRSAAYKAVEDKVISIYETAVAAGFSPDLGCATMCCEGVEETKKRQSLTKAEASRLMSFLKE